MFNKGDIVLIDTNVIIESHRTGCWNQISNHFTFHTVAKVIEETQTGFQNRKPEESIDETLLRNSIQHIEVITDIQIIEFNIRSGHPALDLGERDLMIYAELISGNAWFLNSPDVASIRFAHNKGWLDRLVSLGAMTTCLKSRLKKNLAGNYTEPWLSERKLDFRMKLL